MYLYVGKKGGFVNGGKFNFHEKKKKSFFDRLLLGKIEHTLVYAFAHHLVYEN